MLSLQKIQALRRIKDEFEDINRINNSNIGVAFGIMDEYNIFKWKISMIGSRDTLYNVLKLQFII